MFQVNLARISRWHGQDYHLTDSISPGIALKNWRYWKETPKHIHAYSQRFEWQSFASKLAVLELAESIGSKDPAFLAQSRREMMEALHFKLAEVRGDPIFQSEMERHDIRESAQSSLLYPEKHS